MLRAYGNSLTTVGALRGLVTHEFTKSELELHDPRFPVEVCAAALRDVSEGEDGRVLAAPLGGIRIGRVCSLIRRILHCSCMEDQTIERRRSMWPPAKSLEAKHLRNCSLVESREKMLEFMPKKAVCAELGIWRCDFSERIIQKTQPATLHLIDIDSKAVQVAERRFSREISSGSVQVHQGSSAETVLSMPDAYFDWVYIDADHSYKGVKKDLQAVRLKLKPTGLIALNDYIYFGSSDFVKYGVVEAVNEFCVEHDFEFVFFALQGRMYNDVAIRKLQ